MLVWYVPKYCISGESEASVRSCVRTSGDVGTTVVNWSDCCDTVVWAD